VKMDLTKRFYIREAICILVNVYTKLSKSLDLTFMYLENDSYRVPKGVGVLELRGASGDGGLGEWDTHSLFRIRMMY